MRPIWQMSAVETAEATRAGRLSCVEVIESHSERFEQVEPRLNAVTVDLRESALATARARDEAFRAGMTPGPLHGVPVTIKENVDVTGQATPNGVVGFADVIAPDDSPVVRNLQQAGAIIIGRTNTPEFGFRVFTDNPLRGLTLNPWDPDVTCGGSSGGASASVAAGVGAIAHGNDIGGSLRYPAYCCGCATIRPTLGRVPAYNPSQAEERAFLMQLMSVQGPIAREVRDVRLGLEIMSAFDPRDPLWVPAPLEGPRLTPPIRVAVAEHPDMHAAVRSAIDEAAGALANAGYDVIKATPPEVERLMDVWYQLVFADFRVTMEPAVRRLGSPDINRVIDTYFKLAGPLPDLEAYVRTAAERNRLLREWNLFLEEHPLVLAPPSLLPPLPTNDDLREPDGPGRAFGSFLYMSTMNLLGLPGAVVPTGLHNDVPIGVELIGRRYREDVCLDAAEVIERAVAGGVLCERLWARGDAGRGDLAARPR